MLFKENWLLGLLSHDLLYIVNNTLIVLIYLAFYCEISTNYPKVLGFVEIEATLNEEHPNEKYQSIKQYNVSNYEEKPFTTDSKLKNE